MTGARETCIGSLVLSLTSLCDMDKELTIGGSVFSSVKWGES